MLSVSGEQLNTTYSSMQATKSKSTNLSSTSATEPKNKINVQSLTQRISLGRAIYQWSCYIQHKFHQPFINT